MGHERNARKSAAIAAASPEPRRAQDTHVTGDAVERSTADRFHPKELGLIVPPSILALADEVIE